MKSKSVEIMAPCGSFASLAAALKAGANAVYFGVEQLNMRAKAAVNFRLTDIPEVVAICRENNVKTYLTVNTVLYDHDLVFMKKLIDVAKKEGVTAVIVSDLAAIQYAHQAGIEVHISTQVNVSNLDAVKFFAQYADVIVLARELTLPHITHIIEEIEKQSIVGPSGSLVRIELFAHGALCVAISGKCYMSLATYNSSANRGACLQNCRRAYRVIDDETGDELVVDNQYIMSPKDLSTITFVDQLINAGVSVLKLEGRGRSEDYVYTVTKCYREAADAVLAGTYTADKVAAWQEQLRGTFNRGFWEGGYYLGKKLGDWAGSYGSQATKEKIIVGRCTHAYPKTKRADFYLDAGDVRVGEEFLVTGKTTGAVMGTVTTVFVDGASVDHADKGAIITMDVPERVREHDRLFMLRTRT